MAHFNALIETQVTFANIQKGWLGQHSPYSNRLQTGQSRYQILVGDRFSATVQTAPGDHTASYTMGSASFSGENGQCVALITHHHLIPKSKKELHLYSPLICQHGKLYSELHFTDRVCSEIPFQ